MPKDTASHSCPPRFQHGGGVKAGERYDLLLTVCIAQYNKDGRPLWECICDCGNVKVALSKTLRNGMTRSCGCLRSLSKTVHGKADTNIYYRWRNMLNRCLYRSGKSYRDYGERGISVCERWLQFENFYADMGEPPFVGATLERVNNDGNYEPENCRWATRDEQGANKRNNRLVTYRGETKHLAEWSRIVGVKYTTLLARLTKQGMTTDQAFTKGVQSFG